MRVQVLLPLCVWILGATSSPETLSLCEELVKNGDLHGAVERFSAAVGNDQNCIDFLTKNSESPQSLILLASYYNRTGAWQPCVDTVRNVLASDRGNKQGLFLMATSLFKLQNYERALVTLENLLKIDNKNAKAHHLMASVLLDSGNYGDAIASARAALKLNPRSVDTSVLLSGLYLHTNAPSKALSVARRALTATNDSTHLVSLHGMIGDALQAKGDTDGAIASFRKALVENVMHGPTFESLSKLVGYQPRHTNRKPNGPGLHWVSPFFLYDGYATFSFEIVKQLFEQNSAVRIYSLNPKPDPTYLRDDIIADLARVEMLRELGGRGGIPPMDALIVHFVPRKEDGEDMFGHVLPAFPGMKKYIGMTTFEADSLPSQWADSCNKMDEVWVMGGFDRHTFVSSGVEESKVHVLPVGIDGRRFQNASRSPEITEKGCEFSFFSVFQWSKRKGGDILVEAFLRAFQHQRQVCLFLRINAHSFQATDLKEHVRSIIERLRQEHAETKASVFQPPTIYMLPTSTADSLPSLYAAADAFILPLRGGEWAAPIMEAMAAGIPVITTRWGNRLDYLTNENSFLINCTTSPVQQNLQKDGSPFFSSEQHWAEPSLEHTQELMLQVVARPELARRVARQGQSDVLEKWTLVRTADWIRERSQQSPSRVEL